MFPPFDQEKAKKICLSMLEDLKNKKLILEQCSKNKSADRTPGIMLGTLVCTDSEKKEIVLKAASGISRTLKYADKEFSDGSIFVPPVVAQKKIDEALLKNDEIIHVLTRRIDEAKKSGNEELYAELKKQRETLTTESLLNVFSLYDFCCADGKMRSLLSICGSSLPPTGTGDCCEIKLLHYAFLHKLTPLSMCQMFYSLTGEDGRHTGEVYPPCDERCGLLLPSMLGLEIVYRDSDIIVVNKQSGLLSVPGRGEDKQDCIVSRVRRLFPNCIVQPSVHRLDMETSGLMVLAFTKEAHKILSRQFEDGLVKKEYEALLDGVLAQKGIASEGSMELFFRLDIENRPHQIWDSEYGKCSLTQWQILRTERYSLAEKKARPVTRVRFIPHTGRTHQLRLASADSHGFGVPIVGDSLYGKCDEGERLCLHATSLSFIHPVTGEDMHFKSRAPF